MKYLFTGAAVLAAVAVGVIALAPRVAAQTPAVLAWRAGGSSIGASVRDVTSAEAGQAKLDRPAGVYVESVTGGGPAAAAGLQAGDIVVEFDGERVRSLLQFTRLVQEAAPRRSVTAIIVREGARRTLQITPEPSGPFAAAVPERFRSDIERGLRERFRVAPGGPNFDFRAPFDFSDDLRRRFESLGVGVGRLGLGLTGLTDQLAQYFGVTAGALVSSVGTDTPAAAAGLRAGDVITAVAGRPVDDPGDVVSALRGVPEGEGVDVTVMRDRKTLMLRITVPPARGSGGGGVPL